MASHRNLDFSTKLLDPINDLVGSKAGTEPCTEKNSFPYSVHARFEGDLGQYSDPRDHGLTSYTENKWFPYTVDAPPYPQPRPCAINPGTHPVNGPNPGERSEMLVLLVQNMDQKTPKHA